MVIYYTDIYVLRPVRLDISTDIYSVEKYLHLCRETIILSVARKALAARSHLLIIHESRVEHAQVKLRVEHAQEAVV